MAENEKDVPIKEREDGSFLAKVDFPEEIEDEEAKKPKKDKKEEEHDEGGYRDGGGHSPLASLRAACTSGRC